MAKVRNYNLSKNFFKELKYDVSMLSEKNINYI